MGRMHFSSSATVAVLLLLSAGCAPADGAPSDSAPEASESDLSSASECVVDTITLKKGFLADLQAVVAPSMIKDYGAEHYKHVEIPKTLDAALGNGEYGEWISTFHGFDFHPEDPASNERTRARFVGTLKASSGELVDPKLVFAKKRYAATKALFDAMTRAAETKEEHVAPPQTYDRSWTAWTRKSPAGRMACTKMLYPENTTPDYACTIYDVERTAVQTFNGKDARCPTK